MVRRMALAATLLAATQGAPAAEQEAADVVAAQLRLQRFRCDKPVKAARDLENSKPDSAAWLVECRNARYRVQLIPHRAARVEVISPAKEQR
ncbi:MAG TPA: hypothetical protein VK446_14395 [Methylocystis sp.]|nr:hypothetical protein [Methylocystis sp.]